MPVFLAIGGALLVFLPGMPSLAFLQSSLFVAPVLLNAAYNGTTVNRQA
jgi:molybdopterin biosynthesis enzyme